MTILLEGEGQGQKAHIHDIEHHPRLSPQIQEIVRRIVNEGYGSTEEFAMIRDEWERLGKPLCGCGCNGA